MCRLYGVAFFGDREYERDYSRIAFHLANLMIISEESNGGDGNGFALLHKDAQAFVFRSRKKAYDLVYQFSPKYRYSKMFRETISHFPSIWSFMGHTRVTTNGNSLNIQNLHPFVVGDIIGAHNGTIYNFKDLWGTNPIGEPKSENDSEVIFAMLNHYESSLSDCKEIANVLAEMYGSLAISATTQRSPQSLLLVARERSLVVYEDREQGLLWWASTAELLAQAGICQLTMSERLKEKGAIWNLQEHTAKEFTVQVLPSGAVPYYRSFSDRSKTTCILCSNTRQVPVGDIRGFTDMQLNHWIGEHFLYTKDGQVMVQCPICIEGQVRKKG